MGVRLDRLPEFLARRGVRYVLVDGWETRSRSSGDFVDVMGVGWHHTASQTTPERDLGWMYFNSPSRPIGNCLLDRSGLVHLASVRACNTQGKGGPRNTSRGVIPLDSGNARTFSIEVANNGVGERWPDDQIEAYLALTCAVIDCVNETTPGPPLGAGDVFAHFEWAPGRKFDPAGSSWYASGGALWDMDRARGDVFMRLLAGPPVPEPEPVPVEPEPAPVPAPAPSPDPPYEEDPMFIGKTAGHFWIGNGIVARRVSEQTAKSWIARYAVAGRPLRSIREPARDVTRIEDVPAFSSNAVQSLGQLFVEPTPAA